ncbi:hypothetical protein HMSSN036_14180 [Paenibacillus macerans]|nr:hypothetical protein HMSSN036_14180 [Paenibacillus macerans]
MSGFDREARKQGYTYFLCDTVSANGDSADQYVRESQYLNVLTEKQVDGIVMLGGRIDLAKPGKELTEEVVEVGKRLPLLLINGRLPGSSLSRVAADERLGAELATRHLIGLGHRDIAVVGGYRHMSNTLQRIAGFTKTMERHGIPVRREWMLHEGFPW